MTEPEILALAQSHVGDDLTKQRDLLAKWVSVMLECWQQDMARWERGTSKGYLREGPELPAALRLRGEKPII